eukprot:TRINITY_DN13893_c0_g1_i1.p1 TRINITY_DN13893_c0_g1~~TRINITY_DN13893_c0_g1_i1.p1  ORF type:complete len:152 (+),score=24.89 TRINITY_DN13893_c0_g1_i1:74-529(+)
MIRRPPRSTLSSSSAASDVYKRQVLAVLVVDHDAKDDSTNQLFTALRDIVHRAQEGAPSSSVKMSELDDADDVQVHPVFSLSTNHQYWCFRVWSGGNTSSSPSCDSRQSSSSQKQTSTGRPPTPPEWPVMNYASTSGKTTNISMRTVAKPM